jgi:AraC-like DNA-binding protein
LPITPTGVTLPDVDGVRRHALRQAIAQNGDRLATLEHRLAQLEKAAFTHEERLSALEQKPPPPLAGAELRKQRDEVILTARAEGHSLARIATLVGLSKSTISRIVNSNGGDPAPPRVRGRDNGSYRSTWSAARAAVAPGGSGRRVKLQGVTSTGEDVVVYGSVTTFTHG